ncbi:MAG TPA: metal-sensitive transcriptional regulator [Soehngenia sp.]|nr:metal-sensitive transcriptional regulator [Soehngenia sp.]HPP31345.1 metal-sensitive transcriptional regulator [Soehngenia sp.]
MSDKDSVILRLRKVEGQIKGIQKMVEEGKYCGDILIQISAARSALNNVSGIILENYLKNCISQEQSTSPEEIEKLIDVMLKYTKQN